MVYNNTEFYVQDNWKVSNRLTLDYGCGHASAAAARQAPADVELLPGPVVGVIGAGALRPGLQQRGGDLPGNILNAKDPRTGQILTVPGVANTQAAIGTPIPASGNMLNGVRQAGDGIAKTGYTWPSIVIGRASVWRSTWMEHRPR